MRRSRKDAGFVLVEALAALVVTAIAAAGLLAALGAANDRAQEAAVRDLALREARHLIAETAGGDPSTLASHGSAADGRLSWERRIGSGPADANVYSVIVEVEWRTRRRSGVTRLETYRAIQS